MTLDNLADEIGTATTAIIKTLDKNRFNIALGFFKGYSSVDSDSTGMRFCDLDLHYRDADHENIGLINVPIMYIGNQYHILDFNLAEGDELLVLFSDRTLEQWKDTSGKTPQDLTNPVKDSFNHALAIPICTVHYANDVSSTPVDSSAIGLRTKSGNKIEIGNGTVELLDLIQRTRSEVRDLADYIQSNITFSNGGGPTGTPTNAVLVTPIITNLDTIETELDEIKV